MKSCQLLIILILWLTTIAISWPFSFEKKVNEVNIEALEFVEKAKYELAKWAESLRNAKLNWSKVSTPENFKMLETVASNCSKYKKSILDQTMNYPWYINPNIKRQLKLVSDMGMNILPEDKRKKIDENYHRIDISYINYSIVERRNDGSEKPPARIVESDEKLVKNEWVRRREGMKNVRSLFLENVKLRNEAVRLNNYTDYADYWFKEYDDFDFQQEMERIWVHIKPFYLQIHAYLRKKLWERHGSTVVARRGLIPEHLLDETFYNDWSQWRYLPLPYPTDGDNLLTKTIILRNYPKKKMYKLVENFFTSLNFSTSQPNFGKDFILKNYGRDNLCDPSIPDIFVDSSYDDRVLEYFEDLKYIISDVASTKSYMQYKDQPLIYQNEAVRDAVAYATELSIFTPKHLHKIGLLHDNHQTHEADINRLYNVALETIVAFPMMYSFDLWNMKIYKGLTTEDAYNCDWWNLRYTYDGIEPPVKRTKDDFDPAYNMVFGGPYPTIQRFIGSTVGHQFYQALCEKAGQFDKNNPKIKPLHECDIYQNTKAGNALKKMMTLGTSKPWYEVIKQLTGKGGLDVRPLLNYLNPLYKWLKNENKKTGEYIGWETNKIACT